MIYLYCRKGAVETEFYRIVPQGLPEVAFSHSHRTEDKSWRLGVIPGLFEISYIEKGALRIIASDREITVPEGGICCMEHDKMYTVNNLGEKHMHCTVAFRAGEIELTKEKPSENDIWLPAVIEPESCAAFSDGLRRITRTPQEDKLRLSALVFGLMSDITLFSRSVASGENPLCRRAKRYISEHLNERISPADVSAALGISYGHLSRVFAAQTGTTLTDYINRSKLGRVRELLFLSDITLEKAGQSVGFEDVKYLSRLFSHSFGITAREYIASVRSGRV